jgi:hypothetical protein
MALIIPVPPDEAVAAARAALEPAGAALAGGVASVHTFSLAAPSRRALAVYALGTIELLNRNVRSARLVAWHHIVTHASTGQGAVAETVLLEPATHVVGRVSDDPPFLADTLAAVDLAAGVANDGEYELRFLVVPAMYVAAIWVMSVGAADRDRFIVVNAGEIFEAGAVLDADTWYDGLRTEVRRARR